MTEPQPTEHAPHAPSGALPLPRQTTPTWEIELLISGATVFGLLQLPAQVESGMMLVINRTAPDVGALLVPLWIYLQAALVILIGTFVIHLCLRAYWVGLVGLNSVYPGGVKWSSFKKAGPYQLETSRRGRDDIAALIEAADNRASQLFGVGVGLAVALVLPIVLVCMAIAITFALRLLPQAADLPPMTVFMALFLLSFMPWLLAIVLDQRYGARWPPHSRGGRWLRAVLGMYTRIGLGRASNLPMALYTSHAQGHRGNLVIATASFLIMVAVSVQIISRIGSWSPDDLDGLPAFSPESRDILLPQHYASMRAREPALRPLPYIPDPIVRGPYLKLFVPYRVARHNLALSKLCETAAEGQRSSRVAMDCFAQLHDVRINGQPVSGLHFDAAEDPVSGQRGLLAMIPMQDLAAGRHELTLLPMPREIDYGKDGLAVADKAQPREPYWIPFWR